MGRIVGLDYGRKRIGIAVSDPFQSFAVPVKTLPTEPTLEKTLLALQVELSRYGDIEKIVMGLPLLLSGVTGEMALEVQTFAKDVEKALQIPVVLWDERLTSQMADRSLKEQDLSRKKRAKKIDPIAATIILQSYLEHLKNIP